MQATSRALLAFSLFLVLTALPTAAQQRPAQDADLLRAKIEQFEKTDISSKSSSVQAIYQRTLLRLYNEFNSALIQDISELKAMQDVVSGTDTGSQSEIAQQIQKLTRERDETLEKMQTLKGDLQTATSDTGPARPVAAASAPQSVTTTFTRPRSSATRTSAEATPVGSNVALVETASIVPVSTVAAPADSTATITVCGQIRPASLTQTFAYISGADDQALPRTKALANDDKTRRSTLKDDCGPETEAGFTNGSQKDAVVRTLQSLLRETSGQSLTNARGANAEYLGPRFESLSRDTIKKQILLLNEYIGNVKVQVKNKDGKVIATPMTDKDGNYTINLSPVTTDNEPAIYYISTEADNYHTVRDVVIRAAPPAAMRVNIFIEDKPVSLLTRAVVGYEQAGAAAAKRNQTYFFDLFISSTFPFRQKIDPDFGERLRTWVSLRFNSIPQSGEATLGALSTDFATQVAGLQVKDVANVFDFLGGFEYRLFGNNALLPSFDRQTKQKFSLSLIAGGGVITPTDPLNSITVFKVFDDAPGLPAEAKGKEFVAFIQSDRDRFFRQYYAGFRIQTFFFTRHNMPMQRFPAQLDITIGQNEFVTGGKLHGPVFRIEGYYPLPYENLKYINIFGSAVLRPGRPKIGVPLVLQPAPADTVVPASNVALIAVPQPNRDYYRAGVGLDFISFIQKLRDATSKK